MAFDWKNIARYVNYNFVAQAVMAMLGSTRNKPTIGSISHPMGVSVKMIGALPVGLKFKLNGVQFIVGFQYQLDGKLVLDLQTETGSGLFDLTDKAGQDRAIAFLTGNANLRFDDRDNNKRAAGIIKEIAKELKLANKAVKANKPRIKPTMPGGERAPENELPSSEIYAPIRTRRRKPGDPKNPEKVVIKKPTPPVPPMTAPGGRPSKTSRMNKRGFDVVEKRSITYTRKSPSAKLTGIGAAKKPYKKNAIIDADGKKPKRVYIDIKKIDQSTDPPTIRLNQVYSIFDDRDGAYFINYLHTKGAKYREGIYLYDYATGRAITEHFYDDIMNGTKKPGSKKLPGKQPTAKQLAARAKFTKMVKARAAASKKVGAYKMQPEKIIYGVNNANWWAGLGKIPTKGKVNFALVPTDRVAKKLDSLMMASFVPKLKVGITRGKYFDGAPKITSGSSAAAVIRKFFTNSQLETQEYGGALYLNNAGRALGVYVGFVGGITATVMDTRLILGLALEVGATSIILFHNHPSGNLQPSKADENLTAQVNRACQTMDLSLLDHIILTKNSYTSFQESNLL